MSTLADLLGVDEAGLAGTVGAYARRGWTIAAAESLTGGLLTALITEVPGASAVLRGGVVCYATDLKASLVGVDAALLDRVGPVHPETARALAAAIRVRCDATVGVGLTGVAGPDPQGGRPPGTAFVAISACGYDDVRELRPDATARTRPQVRAAAVRAAVDLLAAHLRP